MFCLKCGTRSVTDVPQSQQVGRCHSKWSAAAGWPAQPDLRSRGRILSCKFINVMYDFNLYQRLWNATTCREITVQAAKHLENLASCFGWRRNLTPDLSAMQFRTSVAQNCCAFPATGNGIDKKKETCLRTYTNVLAAGR